MSALVDIQATQSTQHRDRGIARYTADFAAALWRRRPDLVHAFVANPDLAPPGRVEPLVASGRLARADEVDFEGARLLHVCSPFELDVPLSRIWPARAAVRRLPLIVTLYDAIPALFAERYLADPGLRARYWARAELLQAAHAVVTISETTAADAIKVFGVRDERLHVVGAAPSESFASPFSRAAAGSAARLAVPGLREQFVLCTSGLDERKNFERLFAAWARLSFPRAHQLVLVCAMDDASRHHLEHMLQRYGIADDVLMPGFVSDDMLRLLYQSTELFVFPSLYEGYGLPVAEALACGAPTIGSDAGAVRELLSADARFDPTDERAIADAIARALTRPPVSSGRLDSWDDVADRTASVYDRVLAGPQPVGRRRALVAVVTPVPPAASGIAAYSFELVRSLQSHCDVHVFADGERWVDDTGVRPRVPEGVELLALRSLVDDERVRDEYDCVVYCMGNSQYHAGALAALRRRSGVVLAHEARLNDLYALGVDEPGAVPDGFQGALDAMYGSRLPSEVCALGRLPAELAERFGVLMAREIAALADRVVVMSTFASELLRTDIAADDARKVVTVPFAFPAPRADATPAHERAPIIATFGVVNEVKQTALLVEAFPALLARWPDATLAIVGRCGDAEQARLVALADALGVRARVTIATDVSDIEYRGWLDRAAVAVQLRRTSNGECSAAIADCVAAGAPVVVSNVGASRELPDEWATKVEPTVSAVELADVIAKLLDDPAHRAEMAAKGFDYARSVSFDAVARVLWSRVIGPLAGRVPRAHE